MALVPAFRIADWISPLRVNGSRSEARYNKAGETTQYLSLHPLGPWAEFIRRDNPSLELLKEFRHRIWAHRIDLTEATRIGFAQAEEWGLTPYDLVSDDYSACQSLAHRLREEGRETLVVPSAALPGTFNAVILAARVVAPYQVEPIDSVDIPTSLVAEDTTTYEALLAAVRRRGTRSHAALEAWRRERDFDFAEPNFRFT